MQHPRKLKEISCGLEEVRASQVIGLMSVI